MRMTLSAFGVACCLVWASRSEGGDAQIRSHPPLRPLPALPDRPVGQEPAFFVDPEKGADQNDGSRGRPWQTINHALPRLSSGDTLCLRGGVYFENVYCSVSGTKRSPITIRSYPGERAIIDGGFPEFQRSSQTAWEPYGDKGEYRSAKPYKNIRDVVGLFGDSMVGLQTYWHAMDLRAENEFWISDPEKKIMVKPVYCGPGLWYDRQSGYIHVRLAHTHLQNPRMQNYRGEPDPRKLPLIVAPFKSVPLFVDLARHVHFQDLVIRGGGYNVVVLQMGVNIEFDNVIIYGGTYGLRARNTGPFRMVHSAVYGMAPPWGYRTENGLRTYTPRYYDPFLHDALPEDGFPYTDHSSKNRRTLYGRTETFAPNARNIARLPSHALLVTELQWEYSVFYYPYNHDWEIAYCEFTEGHDGIYLSGRNMRFHHNWVDNIQDDAIYFSSVSHFASDQVYFYQNLITRSLMGFSMHSRGGPGGNIYMHRNVVDLRSGVPISRPTPENPEGEMGAYHGVGTHGAPFLGVESLYFYHNTFIAPAYRWGFAHRTLTCLSEQTRRRSFNNLCVYLNRYPGCSYASPRAKAGAYDVQCDGNLHWCADPEVKLPEGYLEGVRKAPLSEANKERYPAGWASQSVLGDPKFVKFGADPDSVNDYRLQKESPAIKQGVILPEGWHDPLRPQGEARPDIGAIPFGHDPLRVGIRSRITVGLSGAKQASE